MDSRLWNEKYWDVISNLYWTPRFLGFGSIPKEKWSEADGEIRITATLVPKTSGRIFYRKNKLDDLKTLLASQEEPLNHLFNLTFAIAADAIIADLLYSPL